MLVPVLTGYWVLRYTHFFKRANAGKTNYEIFFTSAIAGGVLFVSAWSVACILWFLFEPGGKLECVSKLWQGYAPFNYSGTMATMALLAFVFSLVTNSRINDEDAAARWAIQNESRFGWLLRESLEKRRLVEVSTTTGKSYVGWVLHNDPGGWERDVALLPVLSGYRKRDTRELMLTRNYAVLGVESLRDYAVVVSMGQVISICRFDPSVYLNPRRRMAGAAGPPQTADG